MNAGPHSSYIIITVFINLCFRSCIIMGTWVIVLLILVINLYALPLITHFKIMLSIYYFVDLLFYLNLFFCHFHANIYVCRQIKYFVLLKKWHHLPNILKGCPATYPCFFTMISIYSPIMLTNIHVIHSSFPFNLIAMLTIHLIACYTQLHGLFVIGDDLN